MTLRDIDQVCSDCDNFYLEISRKSDKYRKVACHLQVCEEELLSIEREKQDDSERMVAVLISWKRRIENDATYLVLIRAFLRIGNETLAEFITKYAKGDIKTPRVSATLQIDPSKSDKNWDTKSDSEKEKIANDLRKRNKSVRAAYLSLTFKIQKSFISRGVSPATVQMAAQSYGIPEGSSSCFVFSKDDDMPAVFAQLSKHGSWFNFELFLAIVNEIGNDEEKDSFQEYQQKILIPYLQLCIYEIPSQSIGSSSSQLQPASLFLKIVDNLLITGIELKCIQHNLADLLELDYSAFYCQFYKKGCIELFFSVSTMIFNPLQSCYLLWEPSRVAYKVTADIVTIL